MHYLTPKTKDTSTVKFTLDDFAEKMAIVEKINSLAVSFTKEKLPESTQIWVLNYE